MLVQAALAGGELGPPGQAYLACLQQRGLAPGGPSPVPDHDPAPSPSIAALWGSAAAAWRGGLQWGDLQGLQGDLQRGAAGVAGRALGEGACFGAAARSAVAEARVHAAPTARIVMQARRAPCVPSHLWHLAL